jgi:hypothetical protein
MPPWVGRPRRGRRNGAGGRASVFRPLLHTTIVRHRAWILLCSPASERRRRSPARANSPQPSGDSNCWRNRGRRPGDLTPEIGPAASKHGVGDRDLRDRGARRRQPAQHEPGGKQHECRPAQYDEVHSREGQRAQRASARGRAPRTAGGVPGDRPGSGRVCPLHLGLRLVLRRGWIGERVLAERGRRRHQKCRADPHRQQDPQIRTPSTLHGSPRFLIGLPPSCRDNSGYAGNVRRAQAVTEGDGEAERESDR